MTASQMETSYRAYLDCLNRRDWDRLSDFVAPNVEHNGQNLGLEGYRRMLEADVAAIPDLRFQLELLLCQPPRLGARLSFDCTPVGMLFDLPVNGKRVQFTENVFYELENLRIRQVWSVIDKAAIAAAVCSG